MWAVRKKLSDMRDSVMNVPESQRKVREATNNEAWGASSSLMNEIAEATQDYHEYRLVMDMLWKRMDESGKNWRIVYKALTLLEHLIKNGSTRVVEEAQSNVYKVRSLQDFRYVNPKGKDEGINVRERARKLVALISDSSEIRTERDRARRNRTKFTGVSSEDYSGGMHRAGHQGGGAYESESSRDSFDAFGGERSHHQSSEHSSSTYRRSGAPPPPSGSESSSSEDDGSESEEEAPAPARAPQRTAAALRGPARRAPARAAAHAPAPAPPAEEPSLFDFGDSAPAQQQQPQTVAQQLGLFSDSTRAAPVPAQQTFGSQPFGGSTFGAAPAAPSQPDDPFVALSRSAAAAPAAQPQAAAQPAPQSGGGWTSFDTQSDDFGFGSFQIADAESSQSAPLAPAKPPAAEGGGLVDLDHLMSTRKDEPVLTAAPTHAGPRVTLNDMRAPGAPAPPASLGAGDLLEPEVVHPTRGSPGMQPAPGMQPGMPPMMMSPGRGAPMMGGPPMMGGQPMMGQPGMMPMGQPGMMQPGMMQPGMMQPGMMGGRGMMQPGMMQPGIMQPGIMGGRGMMMGPGRGVPMMSPQQQQQQWGGGGAMGQPF